MEFEHLEIISESYKGIFLVFRRWGKTLNGYLKKENSIWKIVDIHTNEELERESVNEIVNHPNIKDPHENKINVYFDDIHSVKADETDGVIMASFIYKDAKFMLFLKKYQQSWHIFEYRAKLNDIGWLSKFEPDFIEKLMNHPNIRLLTLI
ncbi:hypothetical protein [Neobacillus soli]|uniref:hypothetical protein n=1 Tax=Neobacillus soli TaxID=220688 RepID=UPI0008264B2D|nr:hypothetical protein [Neobacillus soli]